MRFRTLLLTLIFGVPMLIGQPAQFNGLEIGLHNLFRISNAETRSISPENFTGEKVPGQSPLAISARAGRLAQAFASKEERPSPLLKSTALVPSSTSG